MDEELMITRPDLANLVRLGDHYVALLVKLTNDAMVKETFDKTAAHVAAKKTKEIFDQIKAAIE